MNFSGFLAFFSFALVGGTGRICFEAASLIWNEKLVQKPSRFKNNIYGQYKIWTSQYRLKIAKWINVILQGVQQIYGQFCKYKAIKKY